MDSDDDFFLWGDGLSYEKVGGELDLFCEFMRDDDELRKPAAETSHYKVIDEERIIQLQDEDISQVSTSLHISRGIACMLLLRNDWVPACVFNQLSEIDYDNDMLVREEKGFIRLMLNHMDDKDVTLRERETLISLIQDQDNDCHHNNYCKICLENIDQDTNMMLSGLCGHPFCTGCWKSYIAVSINQDGPACLQLRCPEPECKANVGPEMIELLATGEDKEKYNRYLRRSYVEGRGHIKWCPSPGCDLAIQISSFDNYDVTCDCSYAFCWNCLEKRHRPVKCTDMDEWMKRSSGSKEEKDNATWIRAFTKPCPKCRTKIDKNHGSILMTCPIPCEHQFCWLCLGPWIDNNSHGTGFCHEEDDGWNFRYSRQELTLYANFHNIWIRQEKRREYALQHIRWANNGLIRKLASVQKVPESELEFVMGALEQIVESRRVLKLSCVYDYRICISTQNRRICISTQNRRLNISYLCNLQQHAEVAVMTLERCAYKDLKKYMNAADHDGEDFMHLRAKLVYLTNINKNYFEEFLTSMDRDLYQADAHMFRSLRQPEPPQQVQRRPPPPQQQPPPVYWLDPWRQRYHVAISWLFDDPWRQQYHVQITLLLDHRQMIFFFGFIFLVLFLSLKDIFLYLFGYIAFL